MKLILDIKPSKHVATTKSEAISKANNNGIFTSGSNGKISYTGYTKLSHNNTEIVVVNLLKVRKKVIQTKKDGKTKSKIVSRAHWIAYAYKFDLNILKAMGIVEVKQQNRNFTIKK